MDFSDVRLERAVISAVLAGNAEALQAKEKYFTDRKCAVIWKALGRLLLEGLAVTDRLLVAHESGIAFEELPEETYDPTSVTEYVDRLHQMWMRRALADFCIFYRGKASSDEDISCTLRSAFDDIGILLTGKAPVQSIDEIFNEWTAKDSHGVGQWPILSLQRMLGEVETGDLILLAGKPSSGKTSFALQVASANALRGRPVLIFSMDTSRIKLIRRLLKKSSCLEISRIQQLEKDLFHEEITAPDLTTLRTAASELRSLPIFIDDRRTHSAQDIVAITKATRDRIGRLNLVVVDFVQLISTPGRNRAQELDQATQMLRAMAGDLQCAVIGLSQLNRNYAHRNSDALVMADLRESGGLEQNADIIIGISRHVTQAVGRDAIGATLSVMKSKDTAVGDILCEFDTKRLNFASLPSPDNPSTKTSDTSGGSKRNATAR